MKTKRQPSRSRKLPTPAGVGSSDMVRRKTIFVKDMLWIANQMQNFATDMLLDPSLNDPEMAIYLNDLSQRCKGYACDPPNNQITDAAGRKESND